MAPFILEERAVGCGGGKCGVERGKSHVERLRSSPAHHSKAKMY